MIFGYTVANDVTARDLQKKDGQWARAKGFDTFCPLGPVDRDRPRSERPARSRRRSTARSAAERQYQPDAPDVPAIIAYVSSFMTLLPGDVIADRHAGGGRSDAVRATRSPSRRGHRDADQPGGRRVTDAPGRGTRRPRAEPGRLRFPPSPTGTLHVGNVRSALVQLGLRPALRRHVRPPHRGHRRGAQHQAGLRVGPRLPALARHRLGRGPGGRRARTSRTSSPSGSRLYADIATRLLDAGARLRLLLHPAGARGAREAGAPRGPHRRLRRPLP